MVKKLGLGVSNNISNYIEFLCDWFWRLDEANLIIMIIIITYTVPKCGFYYILN